MRILLIILIFARRGITALYCCVRLWSFMNSPPNVLRWSQWLAMVIIACGLFVKASVLIPAIFPDYREKNHCLDRYTNTTEKVSASAVSKEEVTKDHSDNVTMVIGFLCMLLGCFICSCMEIYEETSITKYNIPPMKVVGYKGVFGVLATSLLLLPLYFIR